MICTICPRKCGINRVLSGENGSKGFCGSPLEPVLARAGLHFWEEPVISGTKGSGTVFFSGCNLHCVYCQNYGISTLHQGKPVTVQRLREIYSELIGLGAHNINLVTPSHYTHAILESLSDPLPVPVVYNTNGYDSIETLKQLEGKIDIYLPDLKYTDPEMAKKYSGAEDYFSVASSAVIEMQRQVKENTFDSDGIMQRGLVIRHLVLPGNVSQAIKVLDWVKANLPEDTIVSLMSQYTPCGKADEYPTINRKLSEREYDIVLNHAEKTGLENIFIQEPESSSADYIPPFDLSGI